MLEDITGQYSLPSNETLALYIDDGQNVAILPLISVVLVKFLLNYVIFIMTFNCFQTIHIIVLYYQN